MEIDCVMHIYIEKLLKSWIKMIDEKKNWNMFLNQNF